MGIVSAITKTSSTKSNHELKAHLTLISSLLYLCSAEANKLKLCLLTLFQKAQFQKSNEVAQLKKRLFSLFIFSSNCFFLLSLYSALMVSFHFPSHHCLPGLLYITTTSYYHTTFLSSLKVFSQTARVQINVKHRLFHTYAVCTYHLQAAIKENHHAPVL